MRARFALVAALALCLAVPTVAAAAVELRSPYAGADGDLDIMPLGDSITRGHGDPAWRGYRADLRARLAAVGMVPNYVGTWTDGDLDNNHAGTSSARIDQVNAQVPQLMKDYRPDVVLLMAGTNDVGQNYQLDTAGDRMQTLIGRIRTFRPTARVFVATIPALPAHQADVDLVNEQIRAAVAELADPKVSVVPAHIVGQDRAKDLGADGVHPSLCGYAKIAFVWWTYLDNSDVNPTPGSWPGGYWPWGTAPGPCNP